MKKTLVIGTHRKGAKIKPRRGPEGEGGLEPKWPQLWHRLSFLLGGCLSFAVVLAVCCCCVGLFAHRCSVASVSEAGYPSFSVYTDQATISFTEESLNVCPVPEPKSNAFCIAFDTQAPKSMCFT